MGYAVQYKCRKCKKLFYAITCAHPEETVEMMKYLFDHANTSVVVHTCKNGDLGIGDLVGAEKNK